MFNRRLLSLVLITGLVMALASLAWAGVPDPGKSDCAVVDLSGGGAVAFEMTITPAGSAKSMFELDFEVVVHVRDANGLAIPNYPLADIWLDDPGTGLIVLCQGGSTADADTDGNGMATLSGAISGGGGSTTGMAVYVSGVAVTLNADGTGGISLPINVNSPDLTGDLAVDISDIGVFSGDLVTYDFRSDYTHDGLVDISDIGLFSTWMNETCP